MTLVVSSSICVEQTNAVAEQYRDEVDLHLVEQPGS